MCEKCAETFKRLFPDVADDDPICGDLLWGATAFPAGDAEYISKQLETLAAKRRKKEPMADFVDRMCAKADEETVAAMEAYSDEIFPYGDIPI